MLFLAKAPLCLSHAGNEGNKFENKYTQCFEGKEAT
jgi:hypothetical protein